MPTETGDMKLLGNFRKFIDLVSADANYQPANPALQTASLQTQYTAALAAVEGIADKMGPNKVAINERQSAFEALPSLVRRSRNMLKASGADKKILDDAETYVRKLTGKRKSAKTKDDPSTPENEAGANHSASQLSFDNQLGNFGSYIAILKSVPVYTPNENDLKTTGLEAAHADLVAKNNAVTTTFVPLSQTRGVRDQLLYLGADCVVNTGLLGKAYVNAAFGSSSQLFKQIKGLKFARQQK